MFGTNCFAVISLRVGRYKVIEIKFAARKSDYKIWMKICIENKDLHQVALLAQLLVGLCCCGITFAHRFFFKLLRFFIFFHSHTTIVDSMLDLVLPHFGLSLGIGIIDSRLTS